MGGRVCREGSAAVGGAQAGGVSPGGAGLAVLTRRGQPQSLAVPALQAHTRG